MNKSRLFLIGSIVFGCIAMFFQTGCQSKQRPAEEDRISKLAVFYGRYISKNGGKSPVNEKELKDFIQKNDSSVNLDELFVSPRDKESYVVFYGARQSTPGAKTVTVHEKAGVNGKKMVGLATGQVETVDETELKQLLSSSK